MEVLDENIGALNEFGKNSLAVGGLGIKGQRLLVRVELKEIVAGQVGIKLKLLTGSITPRRDALS